MPGCTTHMRGEYLKKILKPEEFRVVDIDFPIAETSPLFRSIGWRFKSGPLIWNINNYFEKRIKGAGNFDLVWIDKGVFFRPGILEKLKSNSNTLVHYTPDTAFSLNQSELFYQALPLYDYCITTKSFEKKFYEESNVNHLLYCTQGYDPGLHRIYHSFEEKHGIAFVGLYEDSRAEVLAKLLERKLQIRLAGEGWRSFAHKFRRKENFNYLGEGLFGEAYARLISGSLIGLGLLAKKFPELHTTRTFEIPACGTALVTERNDETKSFFSDDEAIFFSDIPELIERVESLMAHPESLNTISEKGYQRISWGGYDYPSILAGLLKQMDLRG